MIRMSYTKSKLSGIFHKGDKIHLLLGYAGRPVCVATPWYTSNTTWRDVLGGCRDLLPQLTA